MDLKEPEARNGSAGEGQQQFSGLFGRLKRQYCVHQKLNGCATIKVNAVPEYYRKTRL
jgi:hypothetical protein